MIATYDIKGIILASESPRRKRLLEKMNVSFEIIPSGIDEIQVMDDLPNTYAARMALQKASKVAEQRPDHLVIGSDTVVAIEDRILEKPNNEREAFLMLNLLSGQWHDVWTGLCVICRKYNIEILETVRSSVLFRDLRKKEIETYIKTGEPMDKAGSYGIQGKARFFVRAVKGSYDNIVGLPTFELGKIFYELGIGDGIVDQNKVQSIVPFNSAPQNR